MPRPGAILVSTCAILATVIAHADAAPPPDANLMERLLDEWERKSAGVKSLEVSFYRIDRDGNGAERHYEGIVAFKGPKLGYRDLRQIKLIADDKKAMVPQLDAGRKRVATPVETLVWAAEELWQYKYDSKRVAIYRLDKDLGPRRPEEAPLPFMFGVNASDIRRRYETVLVSESARGYLVKLTPRRRGDYDFRKAWVVLDIKSLLPTRIVLLKPDEKSTEDIFLSQFQINQPVNESYFRVAVPGKPWKVERFPTHQVAAPSKGAAPKRPAGAQATRSSLADADPHL